MALIISFATYLQNPLDVVALRWTYFVMRMALVHSSFTRGEYFSQCGFYQWWRFFLLLRVANHSCGALFLWIFLFVCMLNVSSSSLSCCKSQSVIDIILILLIKRPWAEKGCQTVRVKPGERAASSWASLGWAGPSRASLAPLGTILTSHHHLVQYKTLGKGNDR
jgi:hypothetical protein